MTENMAGIAYLLRIHNIARRQRLAVVILTIGFFFVISGSVYTHFKDDTAASIREMPRPPYVCSQETRYNQMYDSCAEPTEAIIDAMGDSQLYWLAQHLTVAERIKVITCMHRGVEYEAINRILMNNSNPDPITPEHGTTMTAEDLNITALNKFDADGIRYRLKNYFKFMFVKHPLDRIFETYVNVLLNKSHEGTEYPYKRIIPKIFDREMGSEEIEKAKLNFLKVVKYVMSDDEELYFRGPFSKWCRPCTIRYDYIGKAETFIYDMNYIISHNMSKARGFLAPNIIKEKLYEKTLYAYKDIPEDTLDELSDKFGRDISQFGYHWSKQRKFVAVGCEGDCC